MAPSYSGVWNISTQYQYRSDWPVDVNLGAVGIVAGGQTAGSGSGAVVNTIEKFLTAASSGNTTDFGDLTVARHSSSSMGNDTRAIFAGGWDNYSGNSLSNVIDYITYATAGNATDFGDVATTSSDANASASNNVRGITFGGRIHSNSNIDNAIEYLTIASTGNMLDFGDLSITTGTTANKARHRQGNGMSGSSTRGLASGGYTPAALSNVIQYVTIATTGDSTDFGDMSASTDELGFMSSNTRAVIAGGSAGGGSFRNTIEYVTIASTGNVTDFGDMTAAKAFLMGASSSTKGFIIGGTTASGITNTINPIETILFSTTGNSTDFGDLTTATRSGSANTSGHAAVQSLYNVSSVSSAGNIGIFVGYQVSGADTNAIEHIDINTAGDSTMFGSLTSGNRKRMVGGIGSSVRGALMAGKVGATFASNTIDYFSFQSKGASVDFGDATVARGDVTNFSNETRGLASGGHTGNDQQDVIDYITIASTGNATDFGNMLATTRHHGATSSTTRGLMFGGDSGSPQNVIQYITIASTGNSTDFGDLSSTNSYYSGSVSSNTRAVIHMGGASGDLNTLEYVTTASTGNTTDFGDLTVVRAQSGGVSNGTRGVFGHGALSGGGNEDTMDFITIASTGNATDFGNHALGTYASGSSIATSNGHGGIA
jgi:hypothetical protein